MDSRREIAKLEEFACFEVHKFPQVTLKSDFLEQFYLTCVFVHNCM